MGSRPQRWAGELALNLCMSWLSRFLLMGPVSVFFLPLGFNAECVKPQADCVTSASPSCWSCPLKGNCGPPAEGTPGEGIRKEEDLVFEEQVGSPMAFSGLAL